MPSMKTLTTLLGIYKHTFSHLQRAKKAGSKSNEIVMAWAQGILKKAYVEYEVVGTPYQGDSVIFVGNHVSYLDIPLLMGTIDRVAFVAKSQVRKWPFFGEGAALIGTVFVKRDKANSRKAAKETLLKAIANGKKIAVFPSGTTTIGKEKPWKKGAFDIAHTSGCLVQPFRLTYEPLRESAYIDDDFFLTHLARLLNRKGVKAKIEFHEPVTIDDPIKDCEHWKNWADLENIKIEATIRDNISKSK